MSDGVTFTIRDGDDFDYESFNKDYCNPYISKSELKEKYNLSDGAYYNRSKYAQECTGFKRKSGRQPNKSTRNIYKKYGHYVIEKKIKGTKRYCGTYKDLKTALMVRDILESCSWTHKIITECIKLYGIQRNVKGYNQYNNPLTKEALKKYNEFEKLFFSGEYSYYEMLKMLEFTEHQYNVCYRELRKKHGKIRKKIVRRI